MKNRHFYFMILLNQISAVGLILRETPTKYCVWQFLFMVTFKYHMTLGQIVI